MPTLDERVAELEQRQQVLTGVVRELLEYSKTLKEIVKVNTKSIDLLASSSLGASK